MSSESMSNGSTGVVIVRIAMMMILLPILLPVLFCL